jgi:hypothetical protein
MRSLWNNLGDPSLHLLVIALVVVYLAFGRGPRSEEPEAPLPFCNACHSHYLPGDSCVCPPAGNFAHAVK